MSDDVAIWTVKRLWNVNNVEFGMLVLW